MSDSLPEDLQRRCALIGDGDAQGTPLSSFDYLLFAIATVLIPALLIVIGALI